MNTDVGMMFPRKPQQRPLVSHPAMSVAGLSVEFNTPEGARSRVNCGVEVAQGLPPYAHRSVFLVDGLNDNDRGDWPLSSHGQGANNVTSYFTGVRAGQGMWFNFNTMRSDEYHVAIVPSVQGVNPITGHAGSLNMEQYETCPVHRTPFESGRFCRSCGYAWGKQNYLATTGTPPGYFWLDGFRQQDGKIRQWLFTEEPSRGVATHILGDVRQYAVAFAIYRSVSPKPRPSTPIFRGGGNMSFGDGGPLVSSRSFGTKSIPLEVAAGALIHQSVYDDPRDLSFWRREPEGIIILNYIGEREFEELIRGAGTGCNEGPLAGIPVGNP